MHYCLAIIEVCDFADLTSPDPPHAMSSNSEILTSHRDVQFPNSDRAHPQRCFVRSPGMRGTAWKMKNCKIDAVQFDSMVVGYDVS